MPLCLSQRITSCHPPGEFLKGIHIYNCSHHLTFNLFIILHNILILYYCVSRPTSSPSGMFLQNILNDDLPLKHMDDVAAISEDGLHSPSNLDTRAVDLFLSKYFALTKI